MKNILTLISKNKAVAALILVLLYITTSSFQTQDQDKQVLTIELYESGPALKNLGFYIFQDGKKVEFVPVRVPMLGPTSLELVEERGVVFNKLLSKYYSQGWRIVSSTTAGHTYHCYVLEK